VFIRDGWHVTEFSSFQLKDPIESLKISVSRPHVKTIHIITLYRPRRIPVSEFNIIAKLLANHANLDTYVIGDLNLDFSVPYSPECRKFRSILFQHAFEQIIKDPTHFYTADSGPKQSIIDLIVTNCTKSHYSSGVMNCIISPDHDLTYTIQNKRTMKAPAKTLTVRPICSLDDMTSKRITELIPGGS